jgi:hypothetical protein
LPVTVADHLGSKYSFLLLLCFIGQALLPVPASLIISASSGAAF